LRWQDREVAGLNLVLKLSNCGSSWVICMGLTCRFILFTYPVKKLLLYYSTYRGKTPDSLNRNAEHCKSDSLAGLHGMSETRSWRTLNIYRKLGSATDLDETLLIIQTQEVRQFNHSGSVRKASACLKDFKAS